MDDIETQANRISFAGLNRVFRLIKIAQSINRHPWSDKNFRQIERDERKAKVENAELDVYFEGYIKKNKDYIEWEHNQELSNIPF